MQTPPIDPAALRLYYLQQLGVTVYMPRTAMAGDESETAVEVPGESARDSAIHMAPSVREPDDSGATAQSVRQLLRDIDELPPAAASSERPVANRMVGSSGTEVGDTLAPFQLLFAVLENRVALAVQIPALARAQLGEAESRLLGNLLRWLGLSLPTEAWLQFRWPLPGMSAGTAAVAAKTLAVFLQQASSGKEVQHLLLLGQGLGQCVDATGTDALSFHMWATHGLSEMLAVPVLKREVWHQLLPLHGQIQKNRD